MVDRRARKQAVAYARYCIHALKVDSQRPLHHTRRAGRDGLAKTRVGLGDLSSCGVERESHPAINVLEIRVIEEIVRLPGEPQATLLAKSEVLEQRQVRVDDAGQPKHVAGQGADLSLRRRTEEAGRVIKHGSAVRRVRDLVIRI